MASPLREWLEAMGTTEREERFYWHVVVYHEEKRFLLHRRKGEERIDLSRYLLAAWEAAATHVVSAAPSTSSQGFIRDEMHTELSP